jgi:hypothetical protein
MRTVVLMFLATLIYFQVHAQDNDWELHHVPNSQRKDSGMIHQMIQKGKAISDTTPEKP